MLHIVSSSSRAAPARPQGWPVIPRLAEFAANQQIYEIHDWGKSYRVVRGLVRLDEVVDGQPRLAGLALPGDMIGGEMLLLGTYAFRATALVPCTLLPWPNHRAESVDQTLLHECLKLQQRMPAVLALREGSAMARVVRLLALLAEQPEDDAVAAAGATFQLPTLREMADVMDLTIETTSRALSKLRQAKALIETERRLYRFVADRVAGE